VSLCYLLAAAGSSKWKLANYSFSCTKDAIVVRKKEPASTMEGRTDGGAEISLDRELYVL